MKFDKLIINFIIMFGIMVFLMLGCSNMLHNPSKHEVKTFILKEPKIIYKSIHDTLYKTKTATIDELKFRKRIENLLDRSETAFSDLNEIKNLNIDIQKQNVLLFNRAYEKRVENDSLKEYVKAIKDTLNNANRTANKFYKQQSILKQAQQENKSVNDGINWQFWIAFAIVVMMMTGNLFLTGRLNRYSKKPNTYA